MFGYRLKMVRKANKDRLIFTELIINTGSETIVVKSPSLLAIFQSEKLLEAFEEDPDREYSTREIFSMLNGDIPVQECTIRRILVENRVFFETSKAVDIQKKKGVKKVVVLNVTKFKKDTSGPAFAHVRDKKGGKK